MSGGMGEGDGGKGDLKKLFYVPLTIKMILDCKGEECIIDEADVKSVNPK